MKKITINKSLFFLIAQILAMDDSTVKKLKVISFQRLGTIKNKFMIFVVL